MTRFYGKSPRRVSRTVFVLVNRWELRMTADHCRCAPAKRDGRRSVHQIQKARALRRPDGTIRERALLAESRAGGGGTPAPSSDCRKLACYANGADEFCSCRRRRARRQDWRIGEQATAEITQQRPAVLRVQSAHAHGDCASPPTDRCAAARSARNQGCCQTRARG